jgi:hypothetical protein
MYSKHHKDSETCVAEVVQQFQDAQRLQQAQRRRILTVVELLCEHGDLDDSRDSDDASEDSASIDHDGRGNSQSRGDESRLTGLARVDDQVRRLYGAAPPGTLLYVVTQGSLIAYKLLSSQKMR